MSRFDKIAGGRSVRPFAPWPVLSLYPAFSLRPLGCYGCIDVDIDKGIENVPEGAPVPAKAAYLLPLDMFKPGLDGFLARSKRSNRRRVDLGGQTLAVSNPLDAGGEEQ